MVGKPVSANWHRYDIALTGAILLLLAYVIYLLATNYHSQQIVRSSTEARIRNDTEKQAEVVAAHVSERIRDVERVAGGTEVAAFFENRALGMSMKYGLRESLVQITRHLNAVASGQADEGGALFARMCLIERDGVILAETGRVPGGETARITLGETDVDAPVAWDAFAQPPCIRLSMPVRFRGEDVGRLLAWVDVAPLFGRVDGGPGAVMQWMGLYRGFERVFSPDRAELPLPSAILAGSHAGGGVSVSNGMVFARAAVRDTPFHLVMILRERDVFGDVSPLQQIFGIGAVLATLLFALIGLLRHIEHKRMTAAIEESTERLSLALDAANDGLWDWDLRTDSLYFSPRGMTMLGYMPGEIAGDRSAWMVLIHPEDRPTFDSALAEHMSHADIPFEVESRHRMKNGTWRWLLTRGRVIARDADGQPIRMVGTNVDIESRKEAERLLAEANRELERRVKDRTAMLLQSEKMASIGALAAGVAHEINNPAGFVRGNIDILRRYVEGLLSLVDALERQCAGAETPGERLALAEAAVAIRQQIDLDFIRKDVGNLLDESVGGMERIARIVSDLRDFSHVDRSDAISSCQLNSLVDKAVNVAMSQLRERCDVTMQYGLLPVIPLHGGQMSQVILNLLMNAADAIRSTSARGAIRIATAVDGDWAVLTVSDNGPGIPEANLSRIFDPFFTTKPVGQGTGLGLHICQKIVDAHGGTIRVTSVEGLGATFTVRLPVHGAGGQFPVG